MKLGIIITCNDRIGYLPHLLWLIQKYKSFEAKTVVCCNGPKNPYSNIHVSNQGLNEGDIDLTLRGYRVLQEDLIIKLSADSWLLDEHRILHIFNRLYSETCGYGGNYWINDTTLSSDIFFLNRKNYDLLEEIEHTVGTFEERLFAVFKDVKYIIPQREPVHPNNRHRCDRLGWVMEHTLDLNLEFQRNYNNAV